MDMHQRCCDVIATLLETQDRDTVVTLILSNAVGPHAIPHIGTLAPHVPSNLHRAHGHVFAGPQSRELGRVARWLRSLSPDERAQAQGFASWLCNVRDPFYQRLGAILGDELEAGRRDSPDLVC